MSPEDLSDPLLASLLKSSLPMLLLEGELAIGASEGWLSRYGSDDRELKGREIGRFEHESRGRRLSVALADPREAPARWAVLQAMTEVTPDWVFAKDRAFRFLMVNDAFAAAQGLKPQDMIGRPDTDFWPLDACEGDPKTGRRGFHDDDRSSFAGQIVRNRHDPARDASGAIRIFDTTKGPLRDSSGEIIGVFSYSRDVTSERAAEAALRASETRYRSLFEHLPVGTAEIDTKTGRLLAVNQRLCELSGYSREQLLQMRGDELTHPEDFARDTPLTDELRRGEPSTISSEVRMRCAGGALRWVGLKLVPLGDGEPRHMVVIEDLAERKAAEARLREREAAIQRLQKLDALGRLAGGVAHDFNNLLTVVLSLLPELESRVLADPISLDLVRDVHTASLRAAGLTRQLLAFARQQPSAPTLLDPVAHIRDLTPLLERLAAATADRPRLAVRIDPLTEPILIDPTHLEQAIFNLVSNACDSGATEVTLSLRAGDARTIYEISDDGRGMSEEIRAHLFEPFFTTKEQGKGTGLGLATTYGAVSQAGGAIELDSRPGEGTRFRVVFPAASGTPTTADPAIPRRGRGEVILLVEDEPAVRQVTAKALRRAGYRVIEAEDGLAALEVSAPYDLVLTDVVMPRLAGPDLVVALSARGVQRFLYMSGHTGDAERWDRALSPMLPKPFLPEDLLRAVEAALGR